MKLRFFSVKIYKKLYKCLNKSGFKAKKKGKLI